MIQIEAVDHIQILAPTGSEAEIRRFYGEVLGLQEVEKPPELRPRGGAWFRVGSGPLLLHVGVEDNPPSAGRRHFAFRVADVDATRRYLEAQGVRTGEAPPVASMPRFYAYDPWGNQIEIMNYDPAPPAQESADANP